MTSASAGDGVADGLAGRASVPASPEPSSGLPSEASSPEASSGASSGDPVGIGVDRLARLAAAVDDVLAVGLEDRAGASLQAELGAVETQVRRLSARQTRIVAAMTARRAADAAVREGTDPGRERERAAREVQRELTDQQQWTPTKAKAAGKLGRRLGERPQLADAYDQGRLPARNAELLDDLLDRVSDEHRQSALDRLLKLATTQDAVAFGRSCRRLLAELDHDTAMTDETRRHTQRSATIVQREDGMSVLHARWSGLDAELVHTAIDAFRTVDGPGLRRTPEQRTADAFIELCRVALRHGDTPTQHGIRPHILITVSEQALAAGTGAGEGAWTGPIPVGELRRLCGDANVSRIVLDAKDLPLQASEEVRTVPAGLYRALLVRDRGCIAQGCDTPAGWCDVMHLQTAFRNDGRLSLDNAALGCRTHHRAYDHHHWQLDHTNGRPILRPPP